MVNNDQLKWTFELDRCAKDFEYLCNTYLHIKSKTVIGFPTLKLNSVQRFLWKQIQDQWKREGYVRQVWGKSRQVGSCLGENTLVLTASLQWVPISKISPNDQLIAVDEYPDVVSRGCGRKFRTACVEAVNEVYEPAFELRMNNGRTLIATGPHRFLVRKGFGPKHSGSRWRAVDELNKPYAGATGKHRIRFAIAPWDDRNEFEDGWMGGILDGEGCVRWKRSGVEANVTQVSGLVWDRIIRYLKRNDYSAHMHVDDRPPGPKSKLGSKQVNRAHVFHMNEVLRLLGQTHPVRWSQGQPWEGKALSGCGYSDSESWPVIEEIVPLGPRRMIDLQTSTGTFLANGFVSHNSTLVHALNFWRTNFHDYHNSFIIAHDEPSAYEQFDKIKTFYDALPDPLKSVTKYWAKGKIDFEDSRSRILCGHARNVNVGAGDMNHFLHMTEAARYPNADQVQASIFPSISEAKGDDPSFIIIESTSVYGGEWYKAFAEDAMAGRNGFEFHFIPYYMHDDYKRPLPHDFRLTEEERQLLRLYPLLTPENINWRRHKRYEYNQNPVMFDSEYPLCLTGETKIATQRGFLPLDETKVGDITESGMIEAVIPHGEAEVFTAETSLGYRVTGTAIHRLQKTDGQLVHLGKALGSMVELRPPRFADTYTTAMWSELPTTQTLLPITESWGRFLGYFMGDGSFYVKKGAHGAQPAGTISIACTRRDEDVVKDVFTLYVDLLGITPEQRHPSPGCTEVRASRQGLFRPFTELGMLTRQGPEQRWKRKVRVPEVIWRSPKSVVREFLRGLYEADGCIWKTQCVMLASRYKDFLQDVQVLLLGFGITAKLGQWTARFGNGWSLVCRMEESRRFIQEIGFIGEWKSARGRLVKEKKRHGRNTLPISFEDMVVTVTPSGNAPVYDLTLPAPHTFSANGIAVHNSWEQSWVLPHGTSMTFDPQRLDELSGMIRPGKRAFVSVNGLTYSVGGQLEVWEEPVDGCFYDIGIDIAGGRTNAADWTVLEVVRRDTLEQVAEARGHWDPAGEEFLDLCYWTGMIYNRGQMIPDITGGWGHALLSDLQKRDYPNLWQWRRRDDAKERVSNRVGFLYTHRDKALLVNNAIRVVMRETPKIHSDLLMDELRHFITIGIDEEWSGAPGHFDDLVNSWALALMGAIDEGRRGMPEVKPQPKVYKERCYYHDVDEDLNPNKDLSGDFVARFSR